MPRCRSLETAGPKQQDCLGRGLAGECEAQRIRGGGTECVGWDIQSEHEVQDHKQVMVMGENVEREFTHRIRYLNNFSRKWSTFEALVNTIHGSAGSALVQDHSHSTYMMCGSTTHLQQVNYQVAKGQIEHCACKMPTRAPEEGGMTLGSPKQNAVLANPGPREMSGDASLCSARKIQQQWNTKNTVLWIFRDTTLQEHEAFKSGDAPSLKRFYLNWAESKTRSFRGSRWGLKMTTTTAMTMIKMTWRMTMMMMMMMMMTTTRMDDGRRR